MKKNILLCGLIFGALASCATPAKNEPATIEATKTPQAAAKKSPSVDAQQAEPQSLALPNWASFERQHTLHCSSPISARSLPEQREIAGQSFVIEGSQVRLESARQYPIRIGLLSAIKEAEADSLKNVERAFAAFKKAGVQVVIANGDIALQQFDLEEVMRKLGQQGLPTFVLIGNSESRSAFNRAFVIAEAEHPNLFNLNWNRHLIYGPLDFISLPGYYESAFMGQNSSCLYRDRDLDELGQLSDSLAQQGRRVVLVSHGPPRSRGPKAIDYAFEAGNVGDSALTELIERDQIGLGLFGHILEAGGSASWDLRLGKVAKAGKPYAKLFVNAGSASATPWTMNNGKSSQGMAMIVVVDEKSASYRILKLR